MALKPADIGVETLANLVVELHSHIVANWKGRTPSRENWRLERQTVIAPRNKSPEVVLERAIAMLGKRGVLARWYNQIPVASGLVDGRADKRAAVDLIHVQTGQTDLVELKWASDNPVFAVFEILQYGIAYLLCRDNSEAFGYENKELLRAECVGLQVLAPKFYYEHYDLSFLGEGIRHGLIDLCSRRDDGLRMTFQFLAFAADFQLPFTSGQDVLDQQGVPIDQGPNKLLVDAINNLQPIWGPQAS